MKNYSKFAAFKARTILLTIGVVAFFIASNPALYADDIRLSNSYGCCTPKSVIVLAGTEGDSLSYIQYFNFSFMARTMKKASSVKHSSAQARPAHDTGKSITVSLTGVRNNPYLYSLRKAFYEFITEETRGYSFAELRLQKKIEAARTLFPEHRKALTGNKVTIQ